MNGKTAREILKDTMSDFSADNVFTLSAALSYYAMFSIGPLLAITVALVGQAFGFDWVRDHLHKTIQSMLGEASAKTLDSMMAARQQGSSTLMKMIALGSLVFGATGVFNQLQGSLNIIWGVKCKSGRGVWLFFRNRFLSFGMVLCVGFLLLVSLALSTALAAFTGSFEPSLPGGAVLAHSFDFAVSITVISILFAMIFKFMPDVHIPWNKVLVGGFLTSLLFNLGKFLLGLYLGRESTASAYGAAGSVIVLLMWVYYASVILFLGAEFTQIYAQKTGAALKPAAYAAPVKDKETAAEPQ